MSSDHILVIENRSMLTRAVGSLFPEAYAEARLSTAPNGEYGLFTQSREPANLVVADFSLLGMPVDIYIARLRAANPEARLLLINACADDPGDEEGRRLQAYRHIARRLGKEAHTYGLNEAFRSFSVSRPGVLVASDECLQRSRQEINNLMSITCASSVYLTDLRAEILVQTEAPQQLAEVNVESMFKRCLARLGETGEFPQDDVESMHLQYQDADRYNLYMFNVGAGLLLFLLEDRGAYNCYLETIWNASYQSIGRLRQILGGTRDGAGETLLGHMLADGDPAEQGRRRKDAAAQPEGSGPEVAKRTTGFLL